ncbi:MAG: 50S ribosomal protein L5 [Candidatus Sungbacteria bacterium RIFCSPHIGHO2_02_FULL_47_11]|uniref:Large ribosomal subunit protein uL5 n=1 Tax=Candidatus Sungbacteria bacterium RIFCSPHIGHO2_02_FULL_47_11 TaxID=1802270 RepID=A0A1G2KLW9_9BACT|nr:MAG: 50S ribosomal protein L5 [Candidatus Sungbacteria bacterium RIFCSPHIGHO2_02_FULL_47_11]
MAAQTLQEKYIKEVVLAMREKFGYKNVMAVPKIEKVVVNVGVGRLRDEKEHEEVKKYLALITGQKPSPRPAKKAIASFKTRQGLIVGYQVTLRGRRMYDFLSRLINAALPRTRDFRGIDEKAFDPRGSLTIGIREHIVFPETIGEDYRLLFGLEVTVVTTVKKREEGVELLRLIGFPIKQDKS